MASNLQKSPWLWVAGILLVLVLYFSTSGSSNKKEKVDAVEIKDVVKESSPAAAPAATVRQQFSESDLAQFERPVNEKALEFLLESAQPEIIYSASGNFVPLGNKIYKVDVTANSRLRYQEVNQCNVSTLLDVFELSQNPILPIRLLYPKLSVATALTMSVEAAPVDKSFSKTNSQLLIVYTTCNQLPMTILSLQFLRNTDKLADLLVVDDHSTDGTVEYLRKRGFAVITKPKATGLTDSWNIGYRVAVALGYKSVIFTNNDVLLTTGSIALMNQGLREYALVVPLTTEKGAGHHPAQSIMRAHKLPAAMLSYTDDYRNAEHIQESILKKYIFVPPEQRRCPAELSKSKGLPKFNGFCFSVNVEKINKAAFEPNMHLFNPTDIIVGQEDHLVQRMYAQKLMPIILHCAFVFHFKSVTVSSANFTSFISKMRSYNITVRQKGKSPLAVLEYKVRGNKTTREVDIREDLRWYHPEEQEDFVQDLLSAKKTNKFLDFQRYGLQCQPPRSPDVLFPVDSPTVFTRLLSMYRDFASYSWNIRTNSICVYPSQWPPHCNQLLSSGSTFEPDNYAMVKSSIITIAIAISDPVKNPSAGDVFTAYELGKALTSQFSHVKVRYLRRGIQWYSPEYLNDVDVLITMLDQYDLSRTLSLFQDPTPPSYPKSDEFQCTEKLQIKPNLITIAWARNWFHRWLIRPWIGNYDALLTSSSLTKSFYDKIGSTIGFSTSCSICCPRKISGYKQRYLSKQYLKFSVGNQSLLNSTANDFWQMFPSRMPLPVYVYPIATAIDSSPLASSNISQFSSNSKVRPSMIKIEKYDPKNSIAAEAKRLFSGVDYVFTGSYFNVPRKIMSFDPDKLPEFQGRIVGGNWDKANVTAGWRAIAVGLLPYELVKEAYKYVKIVVDDANHVTQPWGSVNSRVFDALASNCMIVTNGEIGLEELFGDALRANNLKFPLYTTGKDLGSLLKYYLSRESERLLTLSVMRSVVMRQHTYSHRAVQLVDLLESKFGLTFQRKQKSKIGRQLNENEASQSSTNQQVEYDSKLKQIDEEFAQAKEYQKSVQEIQNSSVFENEHEHRRLWYSKTKAFSKSRPAIASETPSFCIGIRTAVKQHDWISVLAKSLIVQHEKSKYREKLSLQLFIVDTEAYTEYTKFLIEMADAINEQHQFPYIQVVVGMQTSNDGANGNRVYGYDDTDRLLHHMLSISKCKAKSNTYESLNSSSYMRMLGSSFRQSCEWIMFTNGDNMYNSAWFDSVAAFATATPSNQTNSTTPSDATKITTTSLVATSNATQVNSSVENRVVDSYDMIGWDFITHHPRGERNDTPNQPIRIAFERGFLDLGSMMIRSELFLKTNSKFLQEAALTKDLFARDYFTVKRLLPLTSPEKVKLIHQYLLLHQ